MFIARMWGRACLLIILAKKLDSNAYTYNGLSTSLIEKKLTFRMDLKDLCSN